MAMAHIKKMALFDNAIFPFHILPVSKMGDVATPCGHFSVFFFPHGEHCCLLGLYWPITALFREALDSMLVLCAQRESGNGITLGSKIEEFDDEAK